MKTPKEKPEPELPWTGAQIVERIGCKGVYRSKKDAFPIDIEIRSARYCYGRNELLVTNGGILLRSGCERHR